MLSKVNDKVGFVMCRLIPVPVVPVSLRRRRRSVFFSWRVSRIATRSPSVQPRRWDGSHFEGDLRCEHKSTRSSRRISGATSRSPLQVLLRGEQCAPTARAGQGIYLLSTLIQLRTSFPPPPPHPATEPDVGIVNLFSTLPGYRFFGSLFDGVFLLAAGVSAVVRWFGERHTRRFLSPTAVREGR
ncbi:hypothetical protein L226DRAFT_96127 [Lentinus tigrinus ALCF2SS1-7]|uniref:uncharacterized protein n=1 Tax=Lentinus tigrinus ALCF2SS1-7 TaxID=1328758 RepID=UPI001166287D|nr:hypothetical protein L226DRAFT_96127 [Lentinus tigrinus ALCF2SS1-7]